jgi:hypothetical protein
MTVTTEVVLDGRNAGRWRERHSQPTRPATVSSTPSGEEAHRDLVDPRDVRPHGDRAARGHAGSTQHQRRLTHTSRTAAPNAGKSTSSTRSRSFSSARTPQRAQAARSSVVSMGHMHPAVTTTCDFQHPHRLQSHQQLGPARTVQPTGASSKSPASTTPEPWSRPPPPHTDGASDVGVDELLVEGVLRCRGDDGGRPGQMDARPGRVERSWAFSFLQELSRGRLRRSGA